MLLIEVKFFWLEYFCRFGYCIGSMLSKHLISSVLTQIPVFILGVISGVFSTRILSDDSKGAFSLFQANSQLFVLVFSLSIQTGIVYFISSKKITKNLVTGMAAFLFIISSLVLVVFLGISYFFDITRYILPEGFNTIFYLITLFILYLFTFLNSIIAAVFQSQSNFKIINLLSLTNSIVNVIMFVGLFFIIKQNNYSGRERLNMVLFTTVSSLFLNTLLWLYYYKKHINVKPDFNFGIKSQLNPFISYNLSIYLGMFVNFFNYRLDLWIVNNYLSEKELSYYSLAANINQIILYLAATIGSVMLPNLSSKTEEERSEIFIKVSRLCFSFFTAIIIVAFLVSSFIIPMLYGIEFSSTISPFKLLLPGILFSCITQLFSIFIVSINRNIYNIIACSIGLVFTLILDLTLIPAFGIRGAAIATSICYFIIFLITYIFVLNQTKRTTFNLFIPGIMDLRNVLNQFKNQIK